jgi:PAS domain S-box-containing protein
MNVKFGIVAKMTILAFVLVAVAALGVGVFSFYGFRNAMLKQSIRLQGEEVNIEAEVKERELEELARDTRFLATTPPVSGIERALLNGGIDSHDGSDIQNWMVRLKVILDEFFNAKTDYIHIDIVWGVQGKERLLSAGRNADRKTVFEESDSLEEWWRSIIEKVKSQSPRQVRLTGIELMRDQAEIIEPHRPVIRAFVPLYDGEERLFGALIVTMDMTPMFEKISLGETIGVHEHFITDEHGNYLYHPDHGKRFGHYLGQRFKMQDEFPEFRRLFDGEGQYDDSGQIIVNEHGSKMVMAYKKLYTDAMSPGMFDLMVEARPFAGVMSGLIRIEKNNIIFVAGVIIVGGIISLLLARRHIGPLKTLEEGILAFSAGKTDIELPTERRDDIGILARAFSDMTMEVEERNKALRSSEERFRLFAEWINDAFWITDMNGDEIFYVSPAFEHIWGVSNEALYEKPALWRESIHRDDRGRVVLADLVARDMNKYREEFRIVCPDGTEKWISNRAFVAEMERGGIRIIGVAKDITEEKQIQSRLSDQNRKLKEMNDQLHDAQNQLLQSEKMASVGQLAAGVAHEINNPAGYVNSNLGTLKIYVDNLLRLLKKYEEFEALLPVTETEEIKRIKDEIEFVYLKGDVPDLISESLEGIGRLTGIVQDLKDFSRVDELEWQWADIHKGIDSTLNIANNELKYRTTVVKHYGELPAVECIASQINQVVMNILVNAAQAIEEKGTITIETGMDGEKWAWIKISDTGKGIPKEELRRVFDPFFTTKPVGKGTGLGLSLCYSIVEAHAGRIEVDSEVGRGTTFTILLPIKQAEQKAEA